MTPASGLHKTEATAAEAIGRDRRGSRRLATGRQIPVVLLAGEQRLGPAVTMRCINISNGGMRLEGPAPLVRGGRAAVELVSTATQRRAIVGIEVVYSHINNRGDCDAGVRFVRLTDETVAANFMDSHGRLVPFSNADNEHALDA
jgi:hypothetical protein